MLISTLAAGLLPAGCDPRIEQLEEGVATEADVRARFGEPEAVWVGPGGERTFEYNRQPEGRKNCMITIGPDGRGSPERNAISVGSTPGARSDAGA